MVLICNIASLINAPPLFKHVRQQCPSNCCNKCNNNDINQYSQTARARLACVATNGSTRRKRAQQYKLTQMNVQQSTQRQRHEQTAPVICTAPTRDRTSQTHDLTITHQQPPTQTRDQTRTFIQMRTDTHPQQHTLTTETRPQQYPDVTATTMQQQPDTPATIPQQHPDITVTTQQQHTDLSLIIPQQLPAIIPQQLPEISATNPQQLPDTIPLQLPVTMQQQLPATIPQQLPGIDSQILEQPASIPHQLPIVMPQQLPIVIPQPLPGSIPSQIPEMPVSQQHLDPTKYNRPAMIMGNRSDFPATMPQPDCRVTIMQPDLAATIAQVPTDRPATSSQQYPDHCATIPLVTSGHITIRPKITDQVLCPNELATIRRASVATTARTASQTAHSKRSSHSMVPREDDASTPNVRANRQVPLTTTPGLLNKKLPLFLEQFTAEIPLSIAQQQETPIAQQLPATMSHQQAVCSIAAKTPGVFDHLSTMTQPETFNRPATIAPELSIPRVIRQQSLVVQHSTQIHQHPDTSSIKPIKSRQQLQIPSGITQQLTVPTQQSTSANRCVAREAQRSNARSVTRWTRQNVPSRNAATVQRQQRRRATYARIDARCWKKTTMPFAKCQKSAARAKVCSRNRRSRTRAFKTTQQPSFHNSRAAKPIDVSDKYKRQLLCRSTTRAPIATIRDQIARVVTRVAVTVNKSHVTPFVLLLLMFATCVGPVVTRDVDGGVTRVRRSFDADRYFDDLLQSREPNDATERDATDHAYTSVPCSSCMMREEKKLRSLEYIKSQVLLKLGFQQPPNVTLPKMSEDRMKDIIKLSGIRLPPGSTYQYDDDMQGDQPRDRWIEGINVFEEEDDSFMMRTEKIIRIAEKQEHLRSSWKGHNILCMKIPDSLARKRIRRSNLRVWLDEDTISALAPKKHDSHHHKYHKRHQHNVTHCLEHPSRNERVKRDAVGDDEMQSDEARSSEEPRRADRAHHKNGHKVAFMINVYRVYRNELNPDVPGFSLVSSETMHNAFDKHNRNGVWVTLDVTQLVNTWLKSMRDNHGFVIRVFKGNTMADEPISRDNDWEKMPVFEMYPQDAQPRRKKRSIGLTCNEKSEETRCCRYPLTVDFGQFGWDWIIAPRQYNANYCAGECNFVFLQKYPHTHIASLAGPLHSPRDGPSVEACCTPRKMSAISMLYFDHDMNIVYGNIPSMVVDRCGCS